MTQDKSYMLEHCLWHFFEMPRAFTKLPMARKHGSLTQRRATQRPDGIGMQHGRHLSRTREQSRMQLQSLNDIGRNTRLTLCINFPFNDWIHLTFTYFYPSHISSHISSNFWQPVLGNRWNGCTSNVSSQAKVNEFYHGNCQERVQTNETGANYRIYLSVHRVMQIHALEKKIYYMSQCWEKENRR